MPSSRTTSIISELFATAEGDLYGVLDGGRSEQVHAFTLSAGLPWAYIPDDVVDDAFKVCAPRIVAFGQWPSAALERFLDEGWGDSRGIFMRGDVGLGTLRRHLVSLLTAELPDGTEVLFRFFDPRVLRVYLPTCAAGELEQVLGPVSEIVVEGEDGESLCRHRHIGGALQTERFAL